MKVLVKLSVMAFMVLAANPIWANEDNTLNALVSVEKIEPGKVQVAYYGKSPRVVRVSIYNEDNQAVFKESIKSITGIKKPYNLTELPYGEYQFKIRVNDEITVHNVKHEAPMYPGNVMMQAESFGEGKIKTMVMGPGVKNFKLRIYDQNNKLLFQQDINQKENYGRVFNLQESGAKKVRLVLSNNHQILQRKDINL
jgi:hypothetical protein